MPSRSYLEGHLKRLLDPEFASMYLEMVFSEALEDGYIAAFPLALDDVIKATKNRPGAPSETHLLRQRLYQIVSKQENLTLENVISALEEVGLTHEIKPVNDPGTDLR